ncbi:hypothetical protein LINPERPRIM_LOCUS28505 [Linum perenne]
MAHSMLRIDGLQREVLSEIARVGSWRLMRPIWVLVLSCGLSFGASLMG